jgi:hypothetical protein
MDRDWLVRARLRHFTQIGILVAASGLIAFVAILAFLAGVAAGSIR